MPCGAHASNTTVSVISPQNIIKRNLTLLHYTLATVVCSLPETFEVGLNFGGHVARLGPPDQVRRHVSDLR